MTECAARVGPEDTLLVAYQIIHHGKVLESSEPGTPVSYRMGEGQWPLELELAMLGEMAGAQLSLEVKARDQVFGAFDPERRVQMDRLDFDTLPGTGELIEFKMDNGELIEGQVVAVVDDKIEVDFNHPYVGRDLEFEIQIQAIL